MKVCTLNSLSNANSPMGSNLSFLRSKYGINFQSLSLDHCVKVATTVEQLDSQSNCYSVGAVPDYDVTFAYINFRQKDFPVSDFQHGDGHTESQ